MCVSPLTQTEFPPQKFALLCSPRALTFTWFFVVVCFVFQINQTKLAHSSLFRSCVYFRLYGPFNCISFHNFS